MKDIVRHFEELSQQKGWIYSYGTIQALNLKLSIPTPDENGKDLDAGKIFFLAEQVIRRFNWNNTGNNAMLGTTYTGAIALCMKSDLSDTYFSELSVTGIDYQQETEDSKYTKHIEPLLQLVPVIGKYLTCADLEVVSMEIIDLIDYLDANRSGILIKYTVRYDV